MSENFDVPSVEDARPLATPPPALRERHVLSARRGGFMRVMPLLFGVGLAAVTSLLVYELSSPSGFLFRILRVDSALVDRLVPVSILVLFFWTLVDLAMTWWYLRGERRALSLPAVAGLPAILFDSGPGVAVNALRNAGPNQSPLLRRLQSALERLAFMGSPQLAHEAFRHESELASEQADESFSTARILVWAMPILGFIGTVLGIGLAVGEFSSFLTGDIDDVELVKGELAKIASGLSFAFDTTLLGLLGSLIAMLTMAWVQKGDRELNADIESLGLALISQMKDEPAIVGAAPQLDDGLLGQVRAGLNAIAEQNTKLVEGMGRLQHANGQLSEVLSQAVPTQQALHTSAKAAVQAGTSLAGNVEQSSQRLLTAVESLGGRLDTVIQANEVYKATATELANIGRRFDRIAELLEDAKASRQVMSQLSTRLQHMEAAQAASAEFIKQLSKPLEFRLMPADGGGAVAKGE